MTDPVDSIAMHGSQGAAESEPAAVAANTSPAVVDEQMPAVDLSWVTTDLIRAGHGREDPEIIRR